MYIVDILKNRFVVRWGLSYMHRSQIIIIFLQQDVVYVIITHRLKDCKNTYYSLHNCFIWRKYVLLYLLPRCCSSLFIRIKARRVWNSILNNGFFLSERFNGKRDRRTRFAGGGITLREKILLTESCTNNERAVFVPLFENKRGEMLLLNSCCGGSRSMLIL